MATEQNKQKPKVGRISTGHHESSDHKTAEFRVRIQLDELNKIGCDLKTPNIVIAEKIRAKLGLSHPEKSLQSSDKRELLEKLGVDTKITAKELFKLLNERVK